MHVWGIRIAALAMVVGLGRLASAEPVDLSKPFEADNDTICLFHLDDVAGGEVKDSVAGGEVGEGEGADDRGREVRRGAEL